MATRPRNRSEGILDAAADLFATRGPAAVSVDDIGAAVGISGPAVYRHFATKEAVVDAVVERAAVRLRESLAEEDVDWTDPDLRGPARRIATVALDNLSGFVTMWRQQGTWGESTSQALDALDARINSVERIALQRLNPDVDDTAVGVRVTAQVAPYIELARHPSPVRRPRLDALMTAAGLAVLSVPPFTRVAPAPPPSAEPSWRPTPTPRERLLHAARDLFRARGYHGVNVDEIGQAAGLSGPSVYRFYKNKAALLTDICDQILQSLSVHLYDAIDAAASADDALERIAQAVTRVTFEHHGLLTLVTIDGSSVPEGPRYLLERRYWSLIEAWGAVLQEARPLRTAAEAETLVRGGLAVAGDCATAVAGRPEWLPEITALVQAHVTA